MLTDIFYQTEFEAKTRHSFEYLWVLHHRAGHPNSSSFCSFRLTYLYICMLCELIVQTQTITLKNHTRNTPRKKRSEAWNVRHYTNSSGNFSSFHCQTATAKKQKIKLVSPLLSPTCEWTSTRNAVTPRTSAGASSCAEQQQQHRQERRTWWLPTEKECTLGMHSPTAQIQIHRHTNKHCLDTILVCRLTTSVSQVSL